MTRTLSPSVFFVWHRHKRINARRNQDQDATTRQRSPSLAVWSFLVVGSRVLLAMLLAVSCFVWFHVSCFVFRDKRKRARALSSARSVSAEEQRRAESRSRSRSRSEIRYQHGYQRQCQRPAREKREARRSNRSPLFNFHFLRAWSLGRF